MPVLSGEHRHRVLATASSPTTHEGATPPAAIPDVVDPRLARRTPVASDFRITKAVGRQLDELISLSTAQALMAELCRKDDVDPSVMDGPGWTPAYFQIRISGLDLEGSNSPYSYLRNMARYASGGSSVLSLYGSSGSPAASSPRARTSTVC